MSAAKRLQDSVEELMGAATAHREAVERIERELAEAVPIQAAIAEWVARVEGERDDLRACLRVSKESLARAQSMLAKLREGEEWKGEEDGD